jgi:hypothetical protein
MLGTRYSCQILMKLEFSWQIFAEYTNTNFHENLYSGSRVVSCGRTYKQADGVDEANSCFSHFTKAPNKDYGFTNNINNAWDIIKLIIKLAIFLIIPRATERFIMSEVLWRSTWHYSKSDVEIWISL